MLECARLTAEDFTNEIGCELIHDLDQFFALDLDMVMIASEVWEHAGHAIQALQHGCHVFVAKPLSFKPEEVISVMEQAKLHDRLVLSGNPLRYDSSLNLMVDRVRNGDIGKPTNIRVFLHHMAMLNQDGNVNQRKVVDHLEYLAFT